jgi:O-antigen/teichoic acid export membrane protein
MGRNGLDFAFRIGVICIFFNGLFYLIQNQLRFELRSKKYAICSILNSSATAASAIWLTYFLHWGLEGLLFGMLVGAVVGCLYGLWELRASFHFQFDAARLKEMLTFSLPLVPSSIAVFISMYVDRIMINHFLSTADVGFYGVAYRLAGVVGLVLMGFQSALTPLLMSRYQEVDTPAHLAKIFRIFLAFGLLVFLTLSIFSKEIIALITTPEYYPSAILIVYLVPAILLSNMYIFAAGISIAKKSHINLWINIMGAILNAVFNWAFIPLWGISGAAIGTLLGYLCVFTVYMYYSQKLYHVPHIWRNIVAASIIIAVLAWIFSRIEQIGLMGVILKLFAVFLAILTLLLTHILNRVELRNLIEILRRKFWCNHV